METSRIALIIALVIAPQVAIWTLIFWRMARQRDSFRPNALRSGEKITLGPVRADYQGWNGRFGVAKTIGTLALLDRRLLFKRPIGRDISIRLAEVCEVSDTVTQVSLKHSFGNYLSLKIRDGSEVVFLVKDQSRWINAIRTAMAR